MLFIRLQFPQKRHGKASGWRVLTLGGLLLLPSAVVLGQEDFEFSEPDGLLAVSTCSSLEPSPKPLAADYRQFAGKTIASIRFEQISVFDLDDPSENNWLYAFLNKIHIDTRSHTVAPQLLFSIGDALNVDTLNETERLLRRLPYLGNAQIYVDEMCGDEVALLVKTRDIWTLEPSFSFGREGGENKHGFGISEENLFGTGNAVSIGYDKTQDRSSISYAFHSPHLFNSRLTLDVGFTETSDGQQTYFSLQSPFYALDTPWAAGVTASDITIKEKIRFKDETINSYRHGSEYNEMFSGMALRVNDSASHRVSAGVSQERNNYEVIEETEAPIPSNENLIYPWLEYQLIENQFAVYQNLNQMHRVEDISMGANFSVRLGYAGKMYDNGADAWRYIAQYDDLLGVGDHHLVKYALVVDGRDYKNDSDKTSAVWGGDLAYHYLHGRKNRYYVSIGYHQGHNLLPHEQLRLGGELGLRGYPVDYQRGEKRYLVSIEKRYISDLHVFNLFRLGTVMYVDFGRAWGGGYPVANHLSNVGFGLRVSSSKAKIGNVFHMDLAFPLVDKHTVDSYQFILKATKSL